MNKGQILDDVLHVPSSVVVEVLHQTGWKVVNYSAKLRRVVLIQGYALCLYADTVIDNNIVINHCIGTKT